MNNFHCITSVTSWDGGFVLIGITSVSLGLGFTRKPNTRWSKKSSCDSLDYQKTSKRRAAFSETTSPPKKPNKPREIKPSSALETRVKNGQTQPFCAKSSVVLRARNPAMTTTKLGVDNTLSPIRNGLRSSVVPSVGLTDRIHWEKGKRTRNSQRTHPYFSCP